MLAVRMGSESARLVLAAMVLACAAVWGAEARAERRGIAVIIGNSEYEHRDIPPVDFAHRDAEAFKRYVTGMLGFPEANVIHLKDATKRQMEDVLGEPGAVMNDLQARLNLLGGRDLEVVVYYSGHGVPGKKGQAYLLPVDVPPHAARREGYGVDALYQTLGKLHGVNSVRVFLDTCFSGSSHAGRLVEGSPVYVEPKLPEGVSEGMMVLTAVTKTQIATWDKEARHGLFTHHLLDALYGKGDQDRDGKVTALEAKAYLDRVMTASAWLMGKREQQATLRGTGNEVLALAGPRGAFPERPGLEEGEAPSTDLGRPPEPEVPPVPEVVVEPAWDHETRRLIQTGLNELGFETGSPDGIFGPRTREAIRKWRLSKGFEATGQLDRDQGDALKAVGQAAAGRRQTREAERRAKLERERQEREAVEHERQRAEKERLAREVDSRRQAELERERSAREARERTRRKRETRDEAERRAREEWQQHGREFRDCEGCPEMVVVPVGEFMMGSSASEEGRDSDEGPRHPVTILRPFAVGKYGVTRTEFARFVEATGHDTGTSCHGFENGWRNRPGRDWRNPGFAQTERDPVVCVNWEDAKAYVRWLSHETGHRYRLLTESEWEYAARAGTRTSRYWGDDVSGQCQYANGSDVSMAREYGVKSSLSCDDGYPFTSPSDHFPPNTFGLHDMAGNVWEWVEDCWNDSYSGAPSDGSSWTVGSDCKRRVVRGGSWHVKPKYLRSASRGKLSNRSRSYHFGFRVARMLNP